MLDQEIRHAHFLAYILDPNRPHGFGDALLREFLKVATSGNHKIAGIRPLDIHLLGFDDAQIIRERDRIDLRIVVKPSTRIPEGLVIALELKINASEGLQQLAAYRDRLSAMYKGYRLVLFYMTKGGEEPSQENRETWSAVSLGKVIDRFADFSQKDLGSDLAREMINSYVKMMQRRHNLSEKTDATEYAQSLWVQHPAALKFLMENRPETATTSALGAIFDCRKEFCRLISDDTISFSTSETSSKRERDVVLYVTQWNNFNLDEKDSPLFRLVLDGGKGESEIRLRWMIWYGGDERQRIYDAIELPVKYKFKPGRTQITSLSVSTENFISDSSVEPQTFSTGFAALVRDFVTGNARKFHESFQKAELIQR